MNLNIHNINQNQNTIKNEQDKTYLQYDRSYQFLILIGTIINKYKNIFAHTFTHEITYKHTYTYVHTHI